MTDPEDKDFPAKLNVVATALANQRDFLFLHQLFKDAPDELKKDIQWQEFRWRCLVRERFCGFESHLYSLRRYILQHEDLDLKLSEKEIRTLREKRFKEIEGTIKEVTHRISFLEISIFIPLMLTKLRDISWSLDKSDAKWGYFREASNCRNRITHPKSARDLNLNSFDEFKRTMSGMDWYGLQLAELAEAHEKQSKIDGKA